MYKLLIADDEPNIREGLSYLDWKKFNITVASTAKNGLEAYDYIKNNEVNILLTDIKMPLLDGLELIRLVKSYDKNIEIVALSGYNDFEFVKHCLKNDVFNYLLKPIDIDEWDETFSEVQKRLDERFDKPDAPVKITAHSKNHIVSAALEYMNEHYSEQITLTDVASHIYSNPTYLSRVLKTETGIGFTELLTKLRIDAAKKLLKNPAYKINEIAESVGYANPRYFTFAFKKQTGYTPYTFRSEHIEDK